MGTPKTIRQLTALARPLLATDLFPSAEPSPAVTDATKVTAQQIKDFIGAVVAASNNGLWDNAGFIQWGQPFGQAGDPAALLHNIEIPDGGNLIFFGKNNGVDSVIAFDVAGGVLQISNQAVPGGAVVIFDGANWAMETFGDGTFHIGPQGDTSKQLNYNSAANEWFMGSASKFRPAGGLTRPFQNVVFASSPVGVAAGDYFFNADTTAGNIVFSLNPAALIEETFVVKKTSADVNSVQLLPTSGTIQDLGAPVANLSFNTQGESLTVYCDGTNFFII